MNRKRFLYSSILAGIGLQFPFQAFFKAPIDFQNISIDQVLGLDISHLEPSPILLEKETYKFFLRMQSAALKDDIHLQIVSGYRSFSQQKQILYYKNIFNRYVKTLGQSVTYYKLSDLILKIGIGCLHGRL